MRFVSTEIDRDVLEAFNAQNSRGNATARPVTRLARNDVAVCLREAEPKKSTLNKKIYKQCLVSTNISHLSVLRLR